MALIITIIILGIGIGVVAHFLTRNDLLLRSSLQLMELRKVNRIGSFRGIISDIPHKQKIAELHAEFNQTGEALLRKIEIQRS